MLAACAGQGSTGGSNDPTQNGAMGSASSSGGASVSQGGGTAGTEGGTGSTGGTIGGSANGGATTGTSGTGDGSPGTLADAEGGSPSGPTDAASVARWTSKAIASPPSYMGNMGGSGCNTSFPTLGFEPDDAAGGRHPLFLYFVGTTFSASDTSARYDSLAAKTVTEAMARRGFYALSVDYDNTLSFGTDKVTCVYDSTKPQSLVSVACALAHVDCSTAIATWGHSQGALMAHIASQFDTRVHAVWTTGYSGGSYPLPVNRLRVVNGAADTMNSAWDTINQAAGYTTGQCPNDGRTECLRSDGSGFIIVEQADCVTSSADHCWFDRRSCGDSAITLEPNWVDKSSTKSFALESNADWVAATALRP
jgi:hypothetical protein